jgi:hypothetical protein
MLRLERIDALTQQSWVWTQIIDTAIAHLLLNSLY